VGSPDGTRLAADAKVKPRKATAPPPEPPICELSDAQLLATLLATPSGTSPQLAELASDLSRLAFLDLEALCRMPGLGATRARRLLAAVELGRRAIMNPKHRPVLLSHHDVFAWALPRLVHLEHEELWLLSLDGRNQLKRADRVAQGGLNGCAVTPRDVLRPAVRNAATGLIVVHNHPSGDPTPSSDDLHMTTKLAIACDLVGIPLIDHVVVARDGVSSLAALGVCDAA